MDGQYQMAEDPKDSHDWEQDKKPTGKSHDRGDVGQAEEDPEETSQWEGDKETPEPADS